MDPFCGASVALLCNALWLVLMWRGDWRSEAERFRAALSEAIPGMPAGGDIMGIDQHLHHLVYSIVTCE